MTEENVTPNVETLPEEAFQSTGGPDEGQAQARRNRESKMQEQIDALKTDKAKYERELAEAAGVRQLMQNQLQAQQQTTKQVEDSAGKPDGFKLPQVSDPDDVTTKGEVLETVMKLKDYYDAKDKQREQEVAQLKQVTQNLQRSTQQQYVTTIEQQGQQRYGQQWQEVYGAARQAMQNDPYYSKRAEAIESAPDPVAEVFDIGNKVLGRMPNQQQQPMQSPVQSNVDQAYRMIQQSQSVPTLTGVPSGGNFGSALPQAEALAKMDDDQFADVKPEYVEKVLSDLRQNGQYEE